METILLIALPILGIFVFGIFIFVQVRSRSSRSKTFSFEEYEVLEIIVPKGEEGTLSTSSLAAEHMFASLHGLLQEDHSLQEHFSFEVVSNSGMIRFFTSAPSNILKFVESQVYAQYPNAKINRTPDYIAQESLEGKEFKVTHVIFEKEDYFPIKIFKDFDVDPLSNIMSTMSEIREGESIWVQVLVKPVPDGWQNEGKDFMESILTGKKKTKFGKNVSGNIGSFILLILKHVGLFLLSIITEVAVGGVTSGDDRSIANAGSKVTDSEKEKPDQFQELEANLVKSKMDKMGFDTVIKVISIAETTSRVEANLRSYTSSLKQYSTASTNDFVLHDYEDAFDIESFTKRRFDPNKAILMNSEELATYYHLPSSRAEAPNVQWVTSKSGEPPANLPITDCTYLGETMFRGKKVRFGTKNGNDRLRHMYLIGKTGAGKSTMLNLMITQDIINGHGVGVLDPHGETIDEVLKKIPDNRVDDVVVFDPSDADNPIGLNLLEIDDPSQKNLLASGLLSAIKEHFDYSWGPRLEYLLNYALLTLLEVPGTTMLGITRLLEDQNYQKYILHQVKDPVVLKFWEQEYKEMRGNQRLVTEAVAPIQNKVNRFLSSSTIRNILVQKKSTINIWDIMQSKKILLINLSKGKIGADNANLLGALLISRIQFMALQRARITSEERVPFYMYVDEFQNFATGSFEEILSESRKYKLALHLTHQYTSQLPDSLLSAVFGNVGTIATFGLGAPDAKILQNEFAPYFDAEDIISLDKFNIYVKLMVDGMTTLPFSARLLLPWEETEMMPDTNNVDKIKELSREKYGTDRGYIEEIIKRWVDRPFDKGLAIAQDAKAKKK